MSSIGNLIQLAAQLVVNLVVTPIVILGLGRELYGAWTMIQQSVGYLGRADLRPMGTLKYLLAAHQYSDDIEEKKRLIGAALLLWMAMLPIIIVIGFVLVWAAPIFIRASPENRWVVQLSMAIAAINIALGRLFSLPSNVLGGMNMAYKAMGLNALMILLAGSFSAIAIWIGWGLPGVALSIMLGNLIIGGARYLVAKRALPWFGVSKPERDELSGFTMISGWILLASLGMALITSSDLLLVGIVINPTAAAVYATTGAVVRMVTTYMQELLASISPGIGDLCGRKEFPRLENIRNELTLVTIGLFAIIGAGILALNQSFLGLWVGEGFFAGNLTNLFLVLIGFEIVLVNTDILIIDGLLQFKSKSITLLVTGITALVIGGILAVKYGMLGVAFGVFIGRLGFLAFFPAFVSKHTGRSLLDFLRIILRPLLTAGLILSLGYFTSSLIQANNWFSFISWGVFIACLSATIMWVVGYQKSDRGLLLRRLSVLFQ